MIPIGRSRRRLHRRAFLGYFGRGTAALAILGPIGVACGEQSSESGSGTAPTESDSEGSWSRVVLGSVSAYVLARNNELAVVDTGRPGSLDAIGQTISDLGFTFNDVKHLALTHHHPDHVGSIGAVQDAAVNATSYAGVLDLERISADDIVGVGDGDEIMGMQVIHTPGHTEGHICLLDSLTTTLVAGDAMNGADGGVTGANPSFTPDMETAGESIKKLAQLEFDTVYFGHGEPVSGGAGAAVRDLAGQL
ncbi:MAG: MBL fold metallo-hydrolase [Acidimicrobiales bacterium]|nr:MBL fold metallo-hydrolase [Acidimicrobiales bacterium]